LTIPLAAFSVFFLNFFLSGFLSFKGNSRNICAFVGPLSVGPTLLVWSASWLGVCLEVHLAFSFSPVLLLLASLENSATGLVW